MTSEQVALSVETNRDYFNRSTRSLTEANSSFAPAPELFTAAAMVAHVAQTVDWFFKGAFAPGGFDMDFEGMDKQVRACASLEAARKWFNEATDRAKAAAAITASTKCRTGLSSMRCFRTTTDQIGRFPTPCSG